MMKKRLRQSNVTYVLLCAQLEALPVCPPLLEVHQQVVHRNTIVLVVLEELVPLLVWVT